MSKKQPKIVEFEVINLKGVTIRHRQINLNNAGEAAFFRNAQTWALHHGHTVLAYPKVEGCAIQETE